MIYWVYWPDASCSMQLDCRFCNASHCQSSRSWYLCMFKSRSNAWVPERMLGLAANIAHSCLWYFFQAIFKQVWKATVSTLSWQFEDQIVCYSPLSSNSILCIYRKLYVGSRILWCNLTASPVDQTITVFVAVVANRALLSIFNALHWRLRPEDLFACINILCNKQACTCTGYLWGEFLERNCYSDGVQ